MELNEDRFPKYLKVRELVDLGDKESLIKCINLMYEKYNALQKAAKYMPPKYIEYLEKIDICLDEIYFDQLPRCETIGNFQAKLKLLEKEKSKVIDSVIKSDLKTKLKELVIDLQENIKELEVNMIREEIEKLRGYIFTEEELEKIIKPAVVASEKRIARKEDLKNWTEKTN